MKKILIALVLILFFSGLVHAQTKWVSPLRYIEYITALEGAVVFGLSGADVTTGNKSPNCVNKFLLKATQANYNGILASLLTAYSMGSPVSVMFNNSSKACEVPAQRININ